MLRDAAATSSRSSGVGDVEGATTRTSARQRSAWVRRALRLRVAPAIGHSSVASATRMPARRIALSLAISARGTVDSATSGGPRVAASGPDGPGAGVAVDGGAPAVGVRVGRESRWPWLRG